MSKKNTLGRPTFSGNQLYICIWALIVSVHTGLGGTITQESFHKSKGETCVHPEILRQNVITNSGYTQSAHSQHLLALFHNSSNSLRVDVSLPATMPRDKCQKPVESVPVVVKDGPAVESMVKGR